MTPAGLAPLVGRAAELGALETGLRGARSCSPALCLLSGEAGLGKTRLVQEFLARSDATVLAGGCVPVAGEALPYAPLTQALRELARSLPATERRRVLDDWPRQLVRLLPDAGEPETAPAGVLDPALDAPVSSSAQVRLFESVLLLVARLGSRGPVVAVVEDVHWADRSTLDLLAFLSRNLRREPLLLVVTYRSDEIPPDGPLRGWLAELARLDLTFRISLERLTRDDTERQIAHLLGPDAAPSLADAVYARSAGNPLFTESLAGLITLTPDRSPDIALPDTLRDLLGARLSALPPDTREVLGVAAVVGRVAGLPLLAELVRRAEDDVELALSAAVERHVVEPRDEGYGFGHPLYREVLYAGLLPGMRRRLHAAAATALDRHRFASAVERAAATGEIARHWAAAGDTSRAVGAAWAAGLAAEQVYAFADAFEHFSRALELSPRAAAGAPVSDGNAAAPEASPVPDRVDVLSHAAQAAYLTGSSERAVALVEEALAVVDDLQREARLLERYGAYCFNAGRFADAEAVYDKALALVPAGPASSLRATLYAGLGMLAMARTQLDQSAQACREAIAIATRSGARREEGRALNALGVVTAYSGDFAEGIGYLRRSLRLAAELDDPDDLASAYIDLGHVLGLAGELDEAVRVCVEGYEAVSKVGLGRQDGGFLRANAAECLRKAGRWDEAAALLTEAVAARPEGLRAFPSLLQSARLAVATGDLAGARERIADIEALLSEMAAPDAWRRELYEAVAELELWDGRPDHGLDATMAGLSLVETSDEQRFAGTLAAAALRALADLAQAARDRRDVEGLRRVRDSAEALVRRLAGLAIDPLDETATPFPEGAAMALDCRAELAMIRSERDGAAAVPWQDSGRRWHALRWPFQEAYACWREAEARLQAGETGRAPTEALRRAHRLAGDLGAAALVREVADLARWYRIDLTLSEPTVAEPENEAAVRFGLTARELEVLEALVAGQTNRQIADSLFISVKTASVHVSNILRKLDVSGREEAARVAHRLGLLPAQQQGSTAARRATT